MMTDFRKVLDAVAACAEWKQGEIRSKMFRHTYCAARLQTLDQDTAVSLFTSSRAPGDVPAPVHELRRLDRWVWDLDLVAAAAFAVLAAAGVIDTALLYRFFRQATTRPVAAQTLWSAAA